MKILITWNLSRISMVIKKTQGGNLFDGQQRTSWCFWWVNSSALWLVGLIRSNFNQSCKYRKSFSSKQPEGSYNWNIKFERITTKICQFAKIFLLLLVSKASYWQLTEKLSYIGQFYRKPVRKIHLWVICNKWYFLITILNQFGFEVNSLRKSIQQRNLFTGN